MCKTFDVIIIMEPIKTEMRLGSAGDVDIFFLKGQRRPHDKVTFKQKLKGRGVSEEKWLEGGQRNRGRGA